MESSKHQRFLELLLSVLLLLTTGVQSQWRFGNYLNRTKIPGSGNHLYDWKAPLEVRQNFPAHFMGFDKEGRVVTYLEVGKWKVSDIHSRNRESIADIRKYWDQHQQMLADLSLSPSVLENGTAVGAKGSAGIADFLDLKFNLINPDQNRIFADIMAVMLRIEDFLAYVFLINLSSRQLWFIKTVIRPLIPGSFRRVALFGTEPEKYIPAILKLIPRDQLPHHLGGYSNFTYLAPLGIVFNHNL